VGRAKMPMRSSEISYRYTKIFLKWQANRTLRQQINVMEIIIDYGIF
jgi:hypothetical protein